MKAIQNFDVLFGESDPEDRPGLYQEGILARAVTSETDARGFVRVRIGIVKNRIIVFPFSRGSDTIASSAIADGILEIPANCPGYRAGQTVRVRLLRPKWELADTLLAVGSHDPLLDEIADMLHLSAPELSMRSCHVGSMGGVMAVRREEAHIAGIHLLDERDGSYNVSFVKKYFPGGNVRLVECMGRVQGLMLAQGNPRRIQGFRALAEPGIRYANRQKGAGTRILFDYLCRKYEIDTEKLEGYGTEKYTHTAVAELIASGEADAGMGIYSVARMYHLDFLPVCTEKYDLLIPDYAWDTPMIQGLLSVLKSGRFARRAEEMGGYRLHSPGRIIL